MTSETALSGLLDALEGTGLIAVPTVSSDAAGAVIDRSFFVEEGSANRETGSGRGAARRSGFRLTESFEIVLQHILNPNEGQRARLAAYRDLAIVQRTLSRTGTGITTEGAIFLGNVRRSRLQQGAVLEQRITCEITFNVDLRLE